MSSPQRRGAAALFCLLASFRPASAHDFGMGGGAYDEFIGGVLAVLGEIPVMLAIVGLGLFIALRDRDGLPRVWLSFMGGSLAGIGLAFLAALDPVVLAYGMAIITGLLAAAALRPGLLAMRLIAGAAGLSCGVAMLTGHEFASVPAGAFPGILFALNLVLAVSAGIAAVALTRLPYSWTPIALRALASWLVAIALMSLAFLLRPVA